MSTEAFKDLLDEKMYHVENYALANPTTDTNRFVKERVAEIVAAHNSEVAKAVVSELENVQSTLTGYHNWKYALKAVEARIASYSPRREKP